MRKSFSNIILLILMTVFLASCSVRKYIPEGQMILKKNKIQITSKDVDFKRSDIENFVVKTEYNNVFAYNSLTWWIYYKTMNLTDIKIFSWVNNKLGDKPIYYSDISNDNSIIQISKYLNDMGYFNSGISSVKKIKNDKLTAIYMIHPSKPYIIDSIRYTINDTVIKKYVAEIEADLPVHKGDNYNVFNLDEQREIISEYLKDNGYYFFTKDYIVMEVDTNNMMRKANINVRINDAVNPTTQKPENHKQYYIDNIYIYPKGLPTGNLQVDTIPYTFNEKRLGNRTFNFVYNGDPLIKESTFKNVIHIYTDKPFNMSSVAQTYKSLNNLKIYDISNIDFSVVENKDNDSINLMNCNIRLSRAKQHFYSFQLEGTLASGEPGGAMNFTYRNKNFLKSAEIFNIKVRGGIQNQHIKDADGSSSIFITKEVGIEASVVFPNSLIAATKDLTKLSQQKTTLALGYNKQSRPIYLRQTGILTFGYNWMQNKYHHHTLTPATVNIVKIDPTPAFEQTLENEINQRIKDQYTSHLICGIDYTYWFSNQSVDSYNDFIYFTANIQSSGNLISAFNNTSIIKTVDNYHEIFGIRYAQYVRLALDLRNVKYITRNQSIATRCMLGVGVPFGNSNDMPFEKSFYAGGPNGMRGWLFRELGPGTYSKPNNLNIECIGDIQLEFNLEYRFPIYGFLKGAVFTDIGNIWTMRENETFVGGEFKFNTFYKQLAADSGVGIRLDFSVFLLRLDAAAPIVNPAYPEGERWRINSLQLNDFILHFGIGYPF